MLPWTHTKNRKRKITRIFSIGVVFLFLFLGLSSATHVFAQVDPIPIESATDTFGVVQVDQTIALASTDIRIIVMKIIRAFLGLLGIISVSLILYAGFLIMTSGGNEDQFAKGKKVMINAVIGLIIILSSVSIVQFVINSLMGTIHTDDGLNDGGYTIQTFSGSGSLGRVIKDHYPFRDQVDVARNTSIMVTFSIPVEPSSFIENTNNTCWNSEHTGPTSTCEVVGDYNEIVNPYYGDCIDINNDGIDFDTDCDHINTSTIMFDTSDKMSSTTIDQNIVGLDASALVIYEGDAQDVFTVVIKPIEYLGNEQENVWYSVLLGKDILKKGSSDSIFSEQRDDFYTWKFRTGIELDLTPPHVTDVYPKAGETVSRNSIIQVNFNEAIDPTTVTGYLKDNGLFKNVLVNGFGQTTTGTWRISNGYKTIAFVSDEACGQNSCGEQMFCLPTACAVGDTKCSSNYTILLRTASDTKNTDSPFEAIPFTGVYDSAFNALNNTSDDATSDRHIKPDASLNNLGTLISSDELRPDNEYWHFTVQNKIDRRSPVIEEILPKIDTEDIEGNQEVKLLFNNIMWVDTLSDIAITEYPENVCADAGLEGGDNTCDNADRLGDFWSKAFTSTTSAGKTLSTIKHREFGPNDIDLYYFPVIPHTVKSVTQNCMYPGYGPSGDKSCTVTYNNDGDIDSDSITNCVPVTTVSSTDTGCVYNDGGYNMLQTSTSTCITQLETVSPSDYIN